MFDKAEDTEDAVADTEQEEQNTIDNLIATPEVPDDGRNNTKPKGELKITDILTKKATVTITGEDEDGDDLKYTLITTPEGGEAKNWGENTTGKYNLTSLTAGTTYNCVAKISDGTETIELSGTFTTNHLPTVSLVVSPGNNQATLSFKGEDEDYEYLEYVIQYKKSTASSYQTYQTLSNQIQGEMKTVIISSLEGSVAYNFKVVAKDPLGNEGNDTKNGTPTKPSSSSSFISTDPDPSSQHRGTPCQRFITII